LQPMVEAALDELTRAGVTDRRVPTHGRLTPCGN
jgi:hypothetical protein